MTGRELPGISGRSETTLFDLEDLITAGSLSNLNERVHEREVEEAEFHQTVKTMIEDGASDRKICATLSIHHDRLTRIKAEKGMSLTARPCISISIQPRADVTNDICALISAGVNDIKGITSHLNLKPDAIKQRLSRMVKSGELIRTGRGRYGLSAARCDFLQEEVIPDA